MHDASFPFLRLTIIHLEFLYLAGVRMRDGCDSYEGPWNRGGEEHAGSLFFHAS